MRKTATFIPVIRPLQAPVFLAIRHWLRQLGLLRPELAFQPCPVKASRRPMGKHTPLLALLALAVGITLSPYVAQAKPAAKHPLIANTPFSTQVQMDHDQILTPFQLKGTYKQAAPPKSTHGIVGLDLLITQTSYPLVTGVFPDTPAEKSGIQTGDLIVSVNGVQAVDKTRAQVDAMISDRPGDTVEFIIGRGERLQKIRLKVAALESLSDFARSGFSAAP